MQVVYLAAREARAKIIELLKSLLGFIVRSMVQSNMTRLHDHEGVCELTTMFPH